MSSHLNHHPLIPHTLTQSNPTQPNRIPKHSSEAAASTPADGSAGLSWRQLQQLDSLALSASSSSAASAVTALSSSAPNPTGGAHALLLHRPHHTHTHSAAADDDARSVGSRLSNAGSTYSAATFYSFSTSNYSGFAGTGELVRRHGPGGDGRHKRHYVHPQELDPNAIYDVDWVQGEFGLGLGRWFGGGGLVGGDRLGLTSFILH